MKPWTISPEDPSYPEKLRSLWIPERGPVLAAVGNAGLLAVAKTALFCSARCPGAAILRTYDQAVKWREAGRCVISGFHSPVEQECLQILLRGKSPVIICPARSLPKRLPPEWGAPLESGRLLVLSGFSAAVSRPTAALAAKRNLLVAGLADDAWFAHIQPGGSTEKLLNRLAEWGLPISKPDFQA